MTAPHDRLAEPLREGALDGLHGAVAVRGGETLLEYYGTGQDFTWNIHLGVVEFGPGTLHDIRSISKSITALLYGIALGDGLVPDATAPLLRQFPEYPDLAADPARARLTVEHALTMSLGLQWREDLPYDDPANAEIAMELAPDRYRYVLERPVIEPPGTRWHYCGGAAALLGRLIADGTGQSLAEYGRAALFTPLEIHDVEWMSGPDGVASAASGLRLTPRALARIGELVLARGRGRVVSSSPPAGSTRCSGPAWRPPGAASTGTSGMSRRSRATGWSPAAATVANASSCCRTWISPWPSPPATTTARTSGARR
ncbi:hypothetical protein GCM10027615_51020 [Plantactinospora veratri]